MLRNKYFLLFTSLLANICIETAGNEPFEVLHKCLTSYNHTTWIPLLTGQVSVEGYGLVDKNRIVAISSGECGDANAVVAFRLQDVRCVNRISHSHLRNRNMGTNRG